MPKIIEAIYEDGVLKPLKKLDLREHEKVKVKLIPRKAKIPKPIQDMIDILHGPLPLRSVEDMAKDSEIEVD